MAETSQNQSPKSKNFESFDLWGKAQFAMWSNVRYDFELIAELTRNRKSTVLCLELLDSVNKHLKDAPTEVFFDGTIKCLKYLVKQGYLDISSLPQLTQNEKYLVELLEKYSKRLDITEVLSDIEEPTVRAMLLEYPHLLGEIVEDPLGGYMVGAAMLKNGITDVESLHRKVDDGQNSIEVDTDKNSKEAMKCKIIYLGLRINSRKLSIVRTAVHIIEAFSTLTDEVVENESYERGIFNSIYAAMYGSDKWNEERKTHLSGCQTLYLDFQLLMLPDNHMSLIYDMFLKEEVDAIGKKYFGERYRPEGFVASLAIKMVVVILLFRTEDFLPAGEKRDVSLFTAGAMLGGLNYAVEETGDTKKPLKLKQWFLDYFRDELDKRVAFIKLQVEQGVGIYKMRDIVRAVYIPVFESFRFFCGKRELVEQTIKLLKNIEISNGIKNDILLNFVSNIQKIVGENQPEEEEKYFKDAFMMLICQAFEGLAKKHAGSLESQAKKYYERQDLDGDAAIAIVELILSYDFSKNDSFIGYMTSNLKFKIKSASRMNMTDEGTGTSTEYGFEEDFWDSIPDAESFIEQLDAQKNWERVREYMDKLPEKEREAVRKVAEGNKKLTDTERKAKNRGLNRIREMMGIG